MYINQKYILLQEVVISKRKIFLSKIVGAEIKAKGWSDFCYKLDNIYHDFIVNSVYSDSKHLYNEIKSHSFINSSKTREGVKYKNNNTYGIDELLKKIYASRWPGWINMAQTKILTVMKAQEY